MMTTTLVLLLATAAFAAPAANVSVMAVAPSTAAAQMPIGTSTQTVSTIYTGDRVRDPFLPAAMGGARSVRRDDAKSVN